MRYEITVNGRVGELSVSKDKVRYQSENGEAVEFACTIVPAGEAVYSILAGERSYRAMVLPDGEIAVNGRVYRVEVFDPREMRARGTAAHTAGRQNVAAQMPGRVVRILVEAGASVEPGQGLIVVEAMKMQNEIKSPQAGKIFEVRTAAGAAVAAGEILMVIE